jgi:hypothetical protein
MALVPARSGRRPSQLIFGRTWRIILKQARTGSSISAGIFAQYAQPAAALRASLMVRYKGMDLTADVPAAIVSVTVNSSDSPLEKFPVEAAAKHSDPRGFGCCDWRVLLEIRQLHHESLSVSEADGPEAGDGERHPAPG